MEEGNSDDDSRTELEDINGRKGLIGGKEDHQEDEDMDSDEEDLEREDENLQGMKDVIVGGEAETASAVTFSRYYSEAHARRLLKADVVDNERMLMTYVVTMNDSNYNNNDTMNNITHVNGNHRHKYEYKQCNDDNAI